MQIHFAPLQGYTDFEYRNTHAHLCGGIDTYYSPFIRWEKGGVRDKDIRDILPENNEGLHLIPQIICGNTDEFNRLCDVVQEYDYGEIDLNMGCPAPMQTKLYRGSGILTKAELVENIFNEMKRRPEVSFSAKMRLGLENKDEWKSFIHILNNSCLKHLTIHPRVGKQMYKGEVDMHSFSQMVETITLPVIYNGDIRSRQEMEHLIDSHPTLHGIMMGRGLLARPTLAMEFLQGKDISREELRHNILGMHEQILERCTKKYRVDSQILLHIHAFWEYMEEQFERKSWKRIMKAGNMKNYLEAVRNISLI